MTLTKLRLSARYASRTHLLTGTGPEVKYRSYTVTLSLTVTRTAGAHHEPRHLLYVRSHYIRIRHPFARLVTMKPRKVRSEAFSEGVAGATTTAP